MTSTHASVALTATSTRSLHSPSWRQWLWAFADLLGYRRRTPDEAAAAAVAQQLASVRAMADRYRRSDPGFASDLYAAADRYERSFEGPRG